MIKRTVGRKLAREFWDKSLDIEAHADRIDALVRREKAKAWDECCMWVEADLCGSMSLVDIMESARRGNPYRGRKKL